MEHAISQHLTESEREFEEQKKLFERIPPAFLEQYNGLFVASKNGEIVDTDEDMDRLVHRFFTTHGDAPVYITGVGVELRCSLDTPEFVDTITPLNEQDGAKRK